MARSVLVETGGVYSPGRGNLKAAKRGEQDKSAEKFESNESGRERGIALVSQSIGAYLAVSGKLFIYSSHLFTAAYSKSEESMRYKRIIIYVGPYLKTAIGIDR